ncbi:CBS domain-containing protein [archaeon]|nr:MAG: CBS domain-containing protein [archaeon]
MFPRILDQIEEIMNKEVATAKPDDHLVDAAKTMLERKIGCVVVVEREKVVGIVTESDLIRCAASGFDPNQKLVKDVMNSPPVTCTPEAPVEEAYAHMRKNNIRHLPIVGEDGALVGIVTMKDLISFGKLIL